MMDVEDRVERALHALAEHIEPDVATARARLAERDAFAPVPLRRLSATADLGDVGRGIGGRHRCRRSDRRGHDPATACRPDRPDARPARAVRGSSDEQHLAAATPPSSSPVETPTTVAEARPRHPCTRAARRARSATGRGPDPFRSRHRLGPRSDHAGARVGGSSVDRAMGFRLGVSPSPRRRPRSGSRRSKTHLRPGSRASTPASSRRRTALGWRG